MELSARCGPRESPNPPHVVELLHSANDGMSVGSPAQHAPGEIRGLCESSLLQQQRRLRRACTRAAHRYDRSPAVEFARASGQFAERDQYRSADMTQRPLVLDRLADVDDLNLVGNLFERLRLDFPDT